MVIFIKKCWVVFFILRASQAIYPILGKTLSSLNASSHISYAVAYECTRTITTIYPDKGLIDKAARCMGVFLVAKTNDIKYLGINTLTSLLQVGSGFVMESAYQRIVIDCLDDPDETLKRKTLDLLCHITNAANVEAVCEKLLSYLKSTTDADVYFRTQLVDRITELAERYAPDNSWYILTINEVFELGGSLVREAVAHNLMRLLAEGTEDEDADNEIRRFAVMSYIDLLEKPVLPDVLVRVICWVLGEYSYTASEYQPQVILEELFSLLERKFEDPSTKGWVISAIAKVTSQLGQLLGSTRDVLEKYLTGVDVELRQRCSEIQELSQNAFLMQSVLPVDGCCEDLEVDESLSFLDGLVSESLSNGASPYKPMSERTIEINTKEISDPQRTLNFTPYDNPMKTPSKPTPQASETTETKQKRSKAHKNPNDVQGKEKNKSKPKHVENPSSSNKLFSGKAVWGPGGYAAKERARSGSVDSSSKSDSSSRSTGSEHTAVQTNDELSASSPLTHQDEVHKQQLADQLFSGVTERSRASVGRGHLGRNRMARHAGKTKLSASVTQAASPDSRLHDIQSLTSVSARQGNMDLLCDVQSADVHDSEIQRARADQHTLLSSLDVISSHDHNMSDFQLPNDRDPLLSVPASDIDLGNKATEQETTLLDSEITDQIQCLELTGTPSASLPEDLAGFPHSPEAIELCCDSNLRVTLQKVWTPHDLVLVLFLTNQNQASASICDVSSILEPPSNLIVSFDSSPTNKFQDDSIGPHEWARHQVALKYQSPALHMNFGGKISYRDPNRTLKHLFFNHTLNISDILRPLAISTEEFGLKWIEASFEKKQKLSSTLRNCQEFSKRAEDKLKLYPVELIGAKVILAGTVMQSGICLLHASYDSGELELSIKSNNRLLNDAILKHCTTVFR